MINKSIRFGVEIVDLKLGGIIPSKNYLIYGTGRTYKTAFGIHFIYEGLVNGGRGIYVSAHDPEALMFQGERMGINLSSFIKVGALVVLNYHPLLIQRISRLMDPRQIVMELKRVSGEPIPERIVFDPLENLADIDNRTNLLTYTRLFLESLREIASTNLFLIEEVENSNVEYFIKEVSNYSFGVFHLCEERGQRNILFEKSLWNERDFPPLFYTVKSGQGILEVSPPSVRAGARTPSPAPLDEVQPGPQVRTGARKGKRTLLMVDDDDIFFDMLRDFMKERFEMELARDSFEAVSKLLSRAYDVILVNVNMPKIDGKEIVLRIRENNSIIPIIAFSNHTKRASDISSILRLGADSFITRAFNFTEVKARVDAVIRRYGTESSYQQAKGLIQAIHEEKKVLQFIPKFDRSTGLNTEEYFKKKVSREIVKAELGDYNFSLTGVRIDLPSYRKSEGLKNSILQAIRKEDLVIELSGTRFLFYLDECLKAGVKRFIDRMRKAIKANMDIKEPRIFYSIATFPIDGGTYDELVQKAIDIREKDKIVSSMKKV